MSALLRLSLQRAPRGGRMPHVPTNEERVQAYRACVLPALGNAFDWRAARDARQAREYAEAEALDARTPTTDIHWSEA